MKLSPLSDRVLIKPDRAPDRTASGLWVQEDWKPEQTGTVVATGVVVHPRKAEAEALAALVEQWAHDWAYKGSDDFGNSTDDLKAAAQMLRALVSRKPQVRVDEDVIFSWQVGQEVWINDGEERYLLMREADILAVVDYEEQEIEGVAV